MNTAILTPIGKGQLTIPYQWRKQMGILGEKVEAFFSGTEVIIRAIPQKKEWDVKKISFSHLNNETLEAIEEGEKSYKNGERDKFLSADEFWKNVL